MKKPKIVRTVERLRVEREAVLNTAIVGITLSMDLLAKIKANYERELQKIVNESFYDVP